MGRYVLGERIAAGGMAEVWAARAEGPEGFAKSVALKFILEPFAGDGDLERLFVREARLAAQLQHANLVAVFDFDKDAATGRYYIAMERVEGHDLRRLLQAAKKAGRTLPPGLALYVGAEVLKGLRYIHAGADGGLVHRDVSPHNVLCSVAGDVKLSDFGIAKAMGSHGTRSGVIRGKLSYASPEQVAGEPVDHRADQFAAGVILWELLAGRRLFDGEDEADVLGRVLRCEIPPLAKDVAAPVGAIVARMLARRRDDRFPTTGEALTAVLTAPGYTADGAALGAFIRPLFPDPATESAETAVIGQVKVAAPGSDEETRTRAAQAPRTIRLPEAPATPPQFVPVMRRPSAFTRRAILIFAGVSSLIAMATTLARYSRTDTPRADSSPAPTPSPAPVAATAVAPEPPSASAAPDAARPAPTIDPPRASSAPPTPRPGRPARRSTRAEDDRPPIEVPIKN